MSYNSIELSLDKRQPVRLYEFSHGSIRFLYNSSAENITYKNQVFKAVLGGIADDGIIRSDGGSSDAVSITAPNDIEIAQLYEAMPPSVKVVLKIYNTHLGASEAVQVWQGEVITVNFSAIDRVKIEAIPVDTASNKLGCEQSFTRSCGACLYDSNCKVNPLLYKKTGVVQQMDLTSITVIEAATLPDGWATAGYIEYPVSNGEYDLRAIEQHVGSTLVLLGGTSGLRIGTTINFYAGCDLLNTTCINKFNNILNFRGVPYLKGSSPFDGNPVGW